MGMLLCWFLCLGSVCWTSCLAPFLHCVCFSRYNELKAEGKLLEVHSSSFNMLKAFCFSSAQQLRYLTFIPQVLDLLVQGCHCAKEMVWEPASCSRFGMGLLWLLKIWHSGGSCWWAWWEGDDWWPGRGSRLCIWQHFSICEHAQQSGSDSGDRRITQRDQVRRMSLFLSISPITPIVSFSEHMSIAKIHSQSAWSLWCFGNVSLLCRREATSFLAFIPMFTGQWSITIGASFLFLLVMGVLECREATATYQSEALGLQKHIQLLQSRLESLGGQTSSLIQWRRARAAAASSTANNLLVVEEKLAARNLEVIPHTVQFHPPLFHYWTHYCTLDARTHSTCMFQNLKIGRLHQLIYHVFPLSCTCIYHTFLSRLLLQKCAGKIHHLIHLADMSKGFLFGSCEGIGSAFRSGLTEWGVGCSWDQMNTVLEKLSSSARELSYYHSGEGPLLFLSLCGGAFASLWCWLVGFRGFILMTLLNPFLIWVPLASLNQYSVTSWSMDLAMQKMGFLSLLLICNPTLAKIKHIPSNCVTGSQNSLMWSVSNVLLL